MSPRIPIERFEAELKELTKDWERFFAGITRVPPEKKRIAFGQRLRRLTEGKGFQTHAARGQVSRHARRPAAQGFSRTRYKPMASRLC